MNPIVERPNENPTGARLMAAALFPSGEAAKEAGMALRSAGFDSGHLSFLQRRWEALNELEPPSLTKSLIRPEEQELAENPVLGAVTGGVLGGAAGWIVGLALVAVPGVGPVLAAGTLATLLGSATVGAVAGGLAGGLLFAGFPEDVAHHYAAQLDGTRCLLAVETMSARSQQSAANVLQSYGGEDVRTFTIEQSQV